MGHRRSCSRPPSPKACAVRSIRTLTGQSQKEFFVNEALSLIDALLRPSVVSSTQTPPSNAVDGNLHRVIAVATDEWTGHEDMLALRLGESWRFVSPSDGMLVFDQSAEQILVYRGQWEAASRPAPATGGTVIDAEARASLDQLIAALARLGILA